MAGLLLPDTPAANDVDHLSHQHLAEALAEELLGLRQAYVLGLHGDWGTGKTSFLKKLMNELDRTKKQQKRPPVVIFFQAWHFQEEPQPVVALLHVLRSKFSTGQMALNEAGKLANASIYTGLALLGDLVKLIPGAAAVPGGIAATARAEGERLERNSLSVPLTAETTRHLFEQAITALVGRNGGKKVEDQGQLIVLVDDLDRCSDEAVVRLLEGLKLYLHADNCTFVVAADKRAIVRAFQRRLFGDEKAESATARARADEYVGKLFQAVVDLPVPSDLEPLLRACCKGPEVDDLVRIQRDHKLLPPNPRKVKRFLTELALRLRTHRANYPGAPEDLSLLCAIQAIQTFHPDIYRLLHWQPEVFQLIHLRATQGQSALTSAGENLQKQFDGLKESRNADYFDPADPQVFRPDSLLRRMLLPPGRLDVERALLVAPAGQAQP